MTRLIYEMTMSLDGYITDPAAGAEDPGRLHGWMFAARTDADAAVVDEMYASVGAVPVVLGGGTRLFEQLETAPIELEPRRCLQTPGATHLRFAVVR